MRNERGAWAGAALLVAALAACGGHRGGPLLAEDPPLGAPAPLPPTATGDTALDAFAWINHRRAQAGVGLLTRNPQIDAAAQGHASYLRLNNVVTHDQTPGLPGYTGAHLGDRLKGAGYALISPYAYGEVLSATSNPSGFYQAEELLSAIYHRFVLLEPVFKEMGTGAATASHGYTYLTADLAASDGYGPGLGRGRCVSYPAADQDNVPVNFFSDSESPDPVPNQNEVGYPISVHADITASVTVTSFTVAPRGGAALATRLLSHATDSETTASVAAIIPLAVLRTSTTYDVNFSGFIDRTAVTRTWSFTTK